MGICATRPFDTVSMALGGQLVVTINAANSSQAGGVTETLPAGFNYVSNSLALVANMGAVYIARRRML